MSRATDIAKEKVKYANEYSPEAVRERIALLIDEQPDHPHGHNIMSMLLRSVSKYWGEKEADQIVLDLELDILYGIMPRNLEGREYKGFTVTKQMVRNV